ncbi:hypothetical protein SAMN05518801_1023 [Novosphingobium sp. CF614]|nr:hypothetical protein SAMN05518801_1023 [Novosphingobium sp. CF614]
MRGRWRRGVIAWTLALALVVLCVAAWIDAGRQPVRDVAFTIAVPELPR